jgi:formylglycine-generating enzyme required for sulfatase activity
LTKEADVILNKYPVRRILTAAPLILLLVILVFPLHAQQETVPPQEKKPGNPPPQAVKKENEKTAEVKTIETAAKKIYQNDKDFREADFGNGIVMVFIPAGRFTMGSDAYINEKPPHPVALEGYWLGKYEVTLGQYLAFISETGYEPLPSWISQYSPADNHPVVGVSWEDAAAYCQWLSKQVGLRFKLPTEAQWEKAARGTDGRQYPWGNHAPFYKGKWYANYAAQDNWDKKAADGFEFTAPVGSFPLGASPYGLLDMAGNVWEWCSDWYNSGYYQVSPRQDPAGPPDGTRRVLRGGCWYSFAAVVRCAERNNARPSFRDNLLGFRLCLENK